MSCPECFSGSVHDDETPRGQVVKIHGLDAYVTEPADGRTPKATIVIVSDAFGWEFVNNRILADHYANKGDYKVILPDFMEGRSAPVYVIDAMRNLTNCSLLWKPYYFTRALWGFLPFIQTNRISKSKLRVRDFFETFRKAAGADARIAAAGFCWGAKHVLLLSHGASVAVDKDGDVKAPLIDVGFVGHPSFFDFSDVAADTMQTPVAFALGELDHNITAAMADQIRTTVEGLEEPARGQVTVYKNCGHGFCVRADSSDKDVTRQALAAEDQCIAWFNGHLGQ